MTHEGLEAPFPEQEKNQQDKSIHQQYQELLAREERERQQVLDAKLAQINSTGDIAELKKDMRLKIAFVGKFGSQRFADLNLKYLQSAREASRKAETEEELHQRLMRTSQDYRTKQLNKNRKKSGD